MITRVRLAAIGRRTTRHHAHSLADLTAALEASTTARHALIDTMEGQTWAGKHDSTPGAASKATAPHGHPQRSAPSSARISRSGDRWPGG